MLQIKTFSLPDQEAEANAFLAVTKPDGVDYHETGGLFSRRVLMTVSCDDGFYPNEYAVVELRNLIQAAGAAKTQQQVAVGVLEMEIGKLEASDLATADQITVLQEDLNGIERYKDKDRYNLVTSQLDAARKNLNSIEAQLSEKRASRDAVLTSMKGQDAKISVVRDLIDDLQA